MMWLQHESQQGYHTSAPVNQVGVFLDPWHSKYAVLQVYESCNDKWGRYWVRFDKKMSLEGTANIFTSDEKIRGIIGSKSLDRPCPRFLSEEFFCPDNYLGSKPRKVLSEVSNPRTPRIFPSEVNMLAVL